MKRNPLNLLPSLLCLTLALPVFALTPAGALEARDSQPLDWPIVLRQHVLRLNSVEWRLRESAGNLCPLQSRATGLAIDYIGAYRAKDRPRVERTLGLSNAPQVVAVAEGSPAARAGLRPGDALLQIGTTAVSALYAQSTERALLADEIADFIAATDAGEPLPLIIRRGATTQRKILPPAQQCATRAILATDNAVDAYSDESDLAVTSAMMTFTRNEDELALIVGHELAHIILRHQASAGIAQRREMEIAADLLGAHLAHCAGYDIARAAEFWPRYQDQDNWRLFRSRTHPSPGQREARIREAIAGFSCPVSLPPSET